MKKLLLSLFSILILLVYPLQARAAAPTIVGPDDRVEITGIASKPEQAVVVIEIQYNRCSGALVAPNIVLTAAHCLTNENGVFLGRASVYAVGMSINNDHERELSKVETNNKERTSSVVKNNETFQNTNPLIFVTKKVEDMVSGIADLASDINNLAKDIVEYDRQMEHTTWGIYHRSFHAYPFAKSRQLWIPKEYRFAILNNDTVKKELYDYGIIILDHNLSEMTEGYLGLKVLSDEELEDANIVAIGRGYDKPKRTLWKSPGKVGEVSEYIIKINADSVKGNSGGPVLKEDDPTNIIALDNREEGKYTVGGYPNHGLRIRQEMIDAVEAFSKISNTVFIINQKHIR